MFFVVYEVVCRELIIPVADFASLDEALAYIAEEVAEEGFMEGRLIVKTQDYRPDYMSV